jgi:lipoprotein-anchoring transpeptidase ErfK/SrfK
MLEFAGEKENRMKRMLLGSIALAAMLFATTVESISAGLVARIDVGNQTMTVSRHGRVIYTWNVSTARRGYVTPRGTYRPTRLHRMWYSRKYDMSPMPYSVFFRGGYAIHGTGYVKQLGRPASHGCVRLATANAARFYSLVKQVGPGNTRIVVVN